MMDGETMEFREEFTREELDRAVQEIAAAIGGTLVTTEEAARGIEAAAAALPSIDPDPHADLKRRFTERNRHTRRYRP